MLNFTGRIALVTGAASGIGKKTAISLAKQGATVGISGRNVEKLEELSAAGAKEHLTLLPIPFDVTSKEQIDQGIEMLMNMHGRIDVLVNNAGLVKESPFLETPEKSWDVVMDTNVKGCFLVAQRVAQEMVKQRYGRIINVSSMLSGGVGGSDKEIASYIASKAAIVGLTSALASELAEENILVNAVAPGYVETDITKPLKENPQVFQQIIQRIPLKRFATPEEIAQVITFLSSEENSYMTGSTIYIDGGWLVG